jgi:hypothetical protein
VQHIVDVGEKAAVRLTSAHYLSPSGRTIQKAPGGKTWGIDPSDGFYVPVTPEQTQARLLAAAARAEIAGKDTQPREFKATIESVEKDQSDPQLAAALKSMIGRLKGEFPKVGKPVAALVADLARREELERRRDALQKEMEKVNKELKELQKR